jgi:hypothetical protein
VCAHLWQLAAADAHATLLLHGPALAAAVRAEDAAAERRAAALDAEVRSATHDALRALATPLPLPWPVRSALPRAHARVRVLRDAALHAAA